MQTTLTIRFFIPVLLALINFTSWASESVSFKIPSPGHLKIEVHKEKSKIVILNAQRKIENLKIDENLAKLLLNADQINTVFTNPIKLKKEDIYVLLVRAPSTKNRGKIFCGAGFEDVAILLSINPRRIKFLDSIEIQSCLKSISLSSDLSDDPIKAIDIDQENKSMSYTILGENVPRTITISENKFDIHQPR